MKTIVVTQARSNSTRLPNKVLMKIQDRTLLQIHVDRIKQAKSVSEVIIATTINKVDDVLVDLANNLKVKVFRGSENDVLDRFYKAVKDLKPDLIVRLTSDCPLIDPQLLDEMIDKAKQKNLDYYSNILQERYPDGQDIEVFTFKALETTWKKAELNSDREHVTPFIRINSSYKGGKLFTSANHNLKEDYSQVRLTVDEPKDFEVMGLIIANLGVEKCWKTYADYYLENEDIKKINNSIVRNEGYLKSLKED
jgi:spore coat polysaccharide biosynthesis protein SpsF (cytidylyltransferase family)